MDEPARAELERGGIVFLYRPRIGVSAVRSLDDVQRFFLVLRVEGRGLVREVVIGVKRLPDPARHERVWALVAKVRPGAADLRDDVMSYVHPTKTLGTRTQPAARAAGEGRYSILEHDGHGHLVYVAELPPDLGDARRFLHIAPAASYILAVLNPDDPAPVGLVSARRAPELPSRLSERFAGRRFAPLDTVEWLDYEGVQLVLIATAASGLERELAGEPEPAGAAETAAERADTVELFRDLGLDPSRLPVEPAYR